MTAQYMTINKTVRARENGGCISFHLTLSQWPACVSPLHNKSNSSLKSRSTRQMNVNPIKKDLGVKGVSKFKLFCSLSQFAILKIIKEEKRIH